MQHTPTTVLLVGAGSRGNTVYAKFALEHPDLVKIVAVAEPNPERRLRVAKDHNIAQDLIFEDWRQIGQDQAVAQVAVIATNDHDHLEPALSLLKTGYHLLLEKPMAPNLDDCRKIVAAAKQARGMSAICHVLRYTAYFRTLKELIDNGAVGEIATIRHFEPVNYWHFAHSFVRGNWRNSATSAPFILAKCCHDMDILLYLMGETPVSIQSYGGLSHFRAESAPKNSATRCTDCELSLECAYSATKFYGDLLKNESRWWPLDVVISEFTQEALEKELRTSPYGRCVYHCDNDVCDHQVVNVQFQSGATASMVATAFTEVPARETDIMGSLGMLRGDGHTIIHRDFRTGSERTHKVESGGNHLGGDDAMLSEFFQAVASGQRDSLSTTPEVSLLSHRMALLAEESRLQGKVIRL